MKKKGEERGKRGEETGEKRVGRESKEGRKADSVNPSLVGVIIQAVWFQQELPSIRPPVELRVTSPSSSIV